MADVTLEHISALLDEKLRPIRAKLERHANQLASQVAPHSAPRLRYFLAGFTTAALLVAVVLAGRTLLGGLDGGSGQSAVTGGERLLYADDLSGLMPRLFPDQQQGTATLPADGAAARWDYAYQDGALVAHVSPASASLGGRVIGGSAQAAFPMTGDFAFEVKAQATSSAASAVFGLRYFPNGREFGIGLQPAHQSYQLWELFKPPLRSAQSAAIEAEQPNTVRLEVRRAALRLFVNGQQVDALQDQAFGGRPASVGLFFDTSAGPGEAPVEVRYTDFRVYSLGG
ncbi:MAG TPA: hypothetical protein VKU60_03540 [Chloroflexota bacterium]|nr:hypothetical protein [Chloroflexota bacterium]